MAHQQAAAGLSMAGKGFFGTLCAGTFGLGVWQTQRYFEKQQLVAERQNALSQPPLDGLSTTNPFRRMRLQGRYLYDKECLVGPRGPPSGALPDKPGYAAGGMSRAPLGYFVVSPLRLDDHRIVLVNRGWIPRNLVYNDDAHKNSQIASRQQPSAPRTRGPQRLSPSWERPQGLVHVTCVSSQPERPRFLVAEHKLPQGDDNHDLPELFWMDLETMQQLASPTGPSHDDQADQNDSDTNNETTMPLVTAVQENDSDTQSFQFPLPPPAQHVGDFKTSPEIHAGYAVTWYGLSVAGLYMTRKLVLKR